MLGCKFSQLALINKNAYIDQEVQHLFKFHKIIIGKVF